MLDAGAAVDVAEQIHAEANTARQRAVSNGTTEPVASDPDDADHRVAATPERDAGGWRCDAMPTETVDDAVVADVLVGLKQLPAALRAGSELSACDAGSLRLYGTELLRALRQEDPGNDVAAVS